jgi:hypothetical protein
MSITRPRDNDRVSVPHSLKAYPQEFSKDKEIAELKARASQLREQTRRMRTSLEGTAIRGDHFAYDELRELLEHPTLAPMLQNLVFLTDEGLIGFPKDGGKSVLGHQGEQTQMDGSPVRIVHPVDLLESREWHEWQRFCFDKRLRQPFKPRSCRCAWCPSSSISGTGHGVFPTRNPLLSDRLPDK